MHYVDINKMYGKITRWELRKNVMYCLEQILEEKHHERTGAKQRTSHLTNKLSKMK